VSRLGGDALGLGDDAFLDVLRLDAGLLTTFSLSAPSRACNWPRSPTACASATAVWRRSIADRACPGARSVVAIRCSSSLTSVSSASYLRRKNARASSGLPACHEPTTRSPSGVRT
jgi:hypothetical protein